MSDFSALLGSFADHTFTAPLDSALPSDIAGTAYTASLDSSILDISQTNTDWTSLLNDTGTYQPAAYSALPQYPAISLPDIDLPMLQLPQLVPVVNSQADFASKQAKLDQLHAMQEAVWRMEQELRSEGVVM